MKIACLAVLLASATPASASPFSFLANGSGETPLAGGASAECSDAQAGSKQCFVTKDYAGTKDKCFGGCLGKLTGDITCGDGCDIFNGCIQECVPECGSQLTAWFNCLSEDHSGPDEEACTCAATKAALRGMMRGFVPKPPLDLKDQLGRPQPDAGKGASRPVSAARGESAARAQKGSEVPELVHVGATVEKKKKKKKKKAKAGKKKGAPRAASLTTPDTIASIPSIDACVAPPGDRANISDRQCDSFCSLESYDGHAFADLVGTDTSTTSSEECLCFDLSDFSELSIASLTKTSGDLDIIICPPPGSEDAADARERREARKRAAVEEE